MLLLRKKKTTDVISAENLHAAGKETDVAFNGKSESESCMEVKGHITYPEPLLILNIHLKLEAPGEKGGGGRKINLELIKVQQRKRDSSGNS